MADRGPLTQENRAAFRGFATPDIWQQMAKYGMGQGDSFPSRFDMTSTGDDEVLFLEMMMKAFKEQEDKKRLGRQRPSGNIGDPLLDEARTLSGR